MNPRIVAAIGVFAALAYLSSFLLLAIPNVTLSILLVFFAGYYIGTRGGIMVGIIGALLISLLNPYGMVQPPILIAQVVGYGLIGMLGGLLVCSLQGRNKIIRFVWLGVLGVVTAVLYQLPVSLVDAFVFGPFWARMASSAAFSIVTIIGNVLFFVILFPFLAKLKKVAIFRAD